MSISRYALCSRTRSALEAIGKVTLIVGIRLTSVNPACSSEVLTCSMIGVTSSVRADRVSLICASASGSPRSVATICSCAARLASSQTFSNASELTILVTFLRMNPVIASCSGACNEVTAWPTSGGRSEPRHRVGRLRGQLLDVQGVDDRDRDPVRHRRLHQRVLGDRRHGVDVPVGVDDEPARPAAHDRERGEQGADEDQDHGGGRAAHLAPRTRGHRDGRRDGRRRPQTRVLRLQELEACQQDGPVLGR